MNLTIIKKNCDLFLKLAQKLFLNGFDLFGFWCSQNVLLHVSKSNNRKQLKE